MIALLQKLNPAVQNVFSVDIKHVYFSLPHASLCSIVRGCMKKKGALGFRNNVGISVEHLLELLHFNLESTVVEF